MNVDYVPISASKKVLKTQNPINDNGSLNPEHLKHLDYNSS